MKQHITIDQLNELSDKGKERLREWWKPSEGNLYAVKSKNSEYVECLVLQAWIRGEESLPLLSIGQMIEFLDWKDMQFYLVPTKGGRYNKDTRGRWGVQDGDYENAGKSFFAESLCDTLWEAVKEILEK